MRANSAGIIPDILLCDRYLTQKEKITSIDSMIYNYNIIKNMILQHYQDSKSPRKSQRKKKKHTRFPSLSSLPVELELLQ